MISIVIPLFNKEKYLEKTIISVLNQTFQNFEIVIIDDGSTDSSLQIAKSFSDSRIHIFTQENQGVSSARNKGIKESRYDYIAFLDADDEWEPDYLECQKKMILNYPECSLFASSYQFKDCQGNIKKIILNHISFGGEYGIMNNYFVVASSSHPPVCSSAIMIRKQSLLDINGFPVSIKAGEDLLTWARLAVNNKIAYCLTPKAYFVLSPSESYEEKPSRVPDINDYVGDELIKLAKDYPDIKGIKAYVALWFKMRASMFLLLNHKKDAYRECIKSLHYKPLNYKIWFYLFLLIIPLKTRYKLFQKLGNK